MSSDVTEGTHICVRCGHGNGAVASFCVECGFDLSSALQRDYDSYRDVSRGELTLSESDGIPVSIIRTLTGVPTAGGELSEPVDELVAQELEPEPGEEVESAPPDRPDDLEEASAEDEVETRIELEGITPYASSELADEDDDMPPGIEPLPMEQIDDPFASVIEHSPDHPKSRPVHENLRKGVTTYVHASERSFRRPGAPEERTSLAITIGSALAIGSVIVVLVLVLTR